MLLYVCRSVLPVSQCMLLYVCRSVLPVSQCMLLYVCRLFQILAELLYAPPVGPEDGVLQLTEREREKEKQRERERERERETERKRERGPPAYVMQTPLLESLVHMGSFVLGRSGAERFWVSLSELLRYSQ